MFNSRMANRMANKKRKGFTLVELVVVILIIAVLAAIAFMGGATAIRQSRESRVQSDLKNFGTYVQDMLYDNPNLQYHEKYSDGEYYTYDPADHTFDGQAQGGTAFADTVIDDFATDYAVGADREAVLNLLNGDATHDGYLTDDFQLTAIVDAWDNPYCFAYDQQAAGGTVKNSACIVVISSLGSDAAHVNATALTDAFVASVADGTAPASAEAFMAEAATVAIDLGDDYGVVIVMVDGQVSVDYYGFD